MEMIKNSPKDCYSTVQKTIMVVLERLQQVRSQLLRARFCRPAKIVFIYIFILHYIFIFT